MRIMEIFELGGSGRGHGHRDNCGDGGYSRRGGYSGGCSCRMNYGHGGSRGSDGRGGGYGSMSSRGGMGGY
jgi:hypothetical protein